MDFYVFHLSNPVEFQNGAKPVLEEVGPFVYKEVRIKEDIVKNMNNTITYKERRQFFFVRSLSCCDENRTITTLNMAVNPIISLIHNQPAFVHVLVREALLLSKETLLVTQEAGKLIFGYNDTLLALINKFDKNLAPTPFISLFYNVNHKVKLLFSTF